MPSFTHQFTVNAPLQTVADFHSRTDILKQLTPPPLFVQIHDFGEMREGMIADFTMWFGPVPIRWKARHVNVSPTSFTDVQQQGPAEKWVHTHTFVEENGATTVQDSIEYAHKSGLPGLFTRLMFAKPNMLFLFTYRKWVTRRGVRKMLAA